MTFVQVIHAGLYYGADSLKTALCVKGRKMLYALCAKHSIPHQNTGKWIVAQNDKQWEELVKIHEFSRSLDGVPTEFVSLDYAAREEPAVQAKAGILSSPSTGILDSHAYMQFLHGDFENRGGDTALYSPVVRIEALGQKGSEGWAITTRDKRTGEESTFVAETIVNSAGLGAIDIHNMIVPPSQHLNAYYAKGNYFSYAASSPSTRRLVYPAPEPGLGGLGTHLTLDISGHIRFGPDVEWVSDPSDVSVSTSPERLQVALEQIKKFLPGIKEDCIVPDYAGIRPKLGRDSAVASGKGFVDFVVEDRNKKGGWGAKEGGWIGWIDLLGIESPGLTSSLAIAEMVEGLLYKQ
jgi:2-hydroxyglutarate dehydrogenase